MSETWRISVVECSENIIIFCPGLQPVSPPHSYVLRVTAF